MRQEKARKSGRPRKFDEASVVHAATMAFWRHGYGKTTAEILSTATGLSLSSLYNTFGSRHGLFVAALDHYNEMLSDRLAPLTMGSKGIEDIGKFLRQLRQSKQGSDAIAGCLMANTLGEGAASEEEIEPRTSLYMRRIHGAFLSALERAVGLDELRPEAAEPLAGIFASSLVGALVMERNGLPGIDDQFTESLIEMLSQWSPSSPC